MNACWQNYTLDYLVTCDVIVHQSCDAFTWQFSNCHSFQGGKCYIIIHMRPGNSITCFWFLDWSIIYFLMLYSTMLKISAIMWSHYFSCLIVCLCINLNSSKVFLQRLYKNFSFQNNPPHGIILIIIYNLFPWIDEFGLNIGWEKQVIEFALQYGPVRLIWNLPDYFQTTQLT